VSGGAAARQWPALARAVFLDRDGVLNDVVWRDGVPASPRTLAELKLVADVGAVTRLRAAGFRLFVVTNQPDVARGRLPIAVLEAIMQQVSEAVRPDEVRWCVHDDADACACRKPKPGMLLDLACDWQVDLAASYMVGDGWRDIGAGRAAGCRTVVLRRSYNDGVRADVVAASLSEAVARILDDRGEGDDGVF
jgi:D-glycero-D-manno-heptose 1,7-bisphosphate phosphatase